MKTAKKIPIDSPLLAGRESRDRRNLGHLGRLKMRYRAATKSRKGINPFTNEPATFKAKPATLQPRFTAGKALKDEASKYFKKKMK